MHSFLTHLLIAVSIFASFSGLKADELRPFIPLEMLDMKIRPSGADSLESLRSRVNRGDLDSIFSKKRKKVRFNKTCVCKSVCKDSSDLQGFKDSSCTKTDFVIGSVRSDSACQEMNDKDAEGVQGHNLRGASGECEHSRVDDVCPNGFKYTECSFK